MMRTRTSTRDRGFPAPARWRTMAFALACLPTSGLLAQADVRGLERCIPADAKLFIGLDDVTDLQQAFAATSLGRWVSSDELAGLRRFLADGLSEFASSGDAKDGVSLMDIPSMVHGGAAVALLDVGSPRATGELPLAFAIILDAGADELRVLDAMDRAIRKDIDSGVLRRTDEAVGEGTVTLIAPGAPSGGASGALDGSADPTELRYTVRRGVFVAVVASRSLDGSDRIGAILSGLEDDLPQALVDSETFQRSGAAAEQSHVRAFIDIGGLLASALVGLVEREKLTEEDVRRIAELGLYDITEAAFTMGFAGSGSNSRLDLRWSGEGAIPSFLQALFRPTKLRTPALFPARPRSAFAAAVDLRSGLASFVDIIEQLMPEAGAQVSDLISATLHQGDIDLERDVLGNIDGEIGTYIQGIQDDLEALPGTEDDPTGLAVIAPIKDRAALERVVDLLLKETGVHAVATELQIGGTAVRKIPGGVVRSLYFSIQEDLLILTTAREVMAATLARRQSGQASLASDPSYRSAIVEMAGEGPSLVWVGDARTGAKDLLSGFLTALQSSPLAGPGGELPFPIPSVNSVDSYFEGSGVRTLSVDASGIRFRSRNVK